jgi:hypothetical protein
MTNANDPDRAERERLASLPGLTKNQRDALRDPTFSMKLCRVLIDALAAQAAAKFEAKPEPEKAMARAFGKTEHVATSGVSFDSRSGVQQFGGGLLEVPRRG